MNPDRRAGGFYVAYLYLLNGMETRALEVMLRLDLPPEVKEAVQAGSQAAGPRGAVRNLLELRIARSQKECTNYRLGAAEAAAFIGDRDRMFKCLDQVRHQWTGASLPTLPLYDDYRSDPRFTAILEEMGLEH